MERGHALNAIARAAGGELIARAADPIITSLMIDSRKATVVSDALFIALKGPNHDGHTYVADLMARGTRNFMVAKNAGIEAREGVNLILVEDTLLALQRVAAWHRSQFNFPVIGITGSNGKTVVKEWLFTALNEDEYIVRSPGSWNSQVGVPLSVWGMSTEHTLGLFEAGISQPGEMQRLAPIIAPTIGIFTNIGPAHGEHFPEGDRQKAQEKAKLFAHSAAVVHCRDHTIVREALIAECPSVRSIDWSREENAFVRLVRAERRSSTTALLIEVNDERHELLLPFTDEASTENAMHVITALLHLGRTIPHIRARIALLKPVDMRMRMTAGRSSSVIIDDSYSNDLASLSIALDHLVRMGGGRRRIAVISDIEESGESGAPLYTHMAQLLQRANVAQVIAVGDALIAHKELFPGHTSFFQRTEELIRNVPIENLTDAAVLIKGARSFGLERVVEHWQERTHGTELRIDLEALRHNLNHYRALLGPQVKVMAMVKAFGYGSGAVELARLFEHERVHYLGVAYADEGVELRQQGIRLPILVMNPEPVPFDVLHRFQLETEVFDLDTLNTAIAYARHSPDQPPVHIKLDTGMHRLGFMAEQVPALLVSLKEAGALRIGSILSHLAASEDPAQDAFTREQLATFNALCDRIDAALGYRPLRHIANSAGASRFPEARSGMVRLGIGLHGVGANKQETEALRPVATLRTVIAQVKDIPKGDSVGYGRRFIAQDDMRIAVLPIGYADGLSRRLSNSAGKCWIAGKAAPFVGSICMDMCMVDVTGIPCSAGQEAILFGDEHPIQDYARDLGTIPYEALTSISSRVRRVYLQA